MTPTNEAGHGLPELPDQDVDTERGDYYSMDAMESYGRACYDLALSRGVPADMVLVPREPTPEMLHAICKAHAGKSEWPTAFGGDARAIRREHAAIGYRDMLLASGATLESDKGSALVPINPTEAMLRAYNRVNDEAYCGGSQHGADIETIWSAMLAAAPAAAGAQGEFQQVLALTQQRGECWPLNKNPKDGWTFDPSFLDEVKTRAEQSDIGEFAPCLEGVESVLIALRGMGDTTTPQPAAADGGVRERAEDLHVAICQAVALMNMEPMTTTGLLQAHDILRKAIS